MKRLIICWKEHAQSVGPLRNTGGLETERGSTGSVCTQGPLSEATHWKRDTSPSSQCNKRALRPGHHSKDVLRETNIITGTERPWALKRAASEWWRWVLPRSRRPATQLRHQAADRGVSLFLTWGSYSAIKKALPLCNTAQYLHMLLCCVSPVLCVCLRCCGFPIIGISRFSCGTLY